MIKKEQRRGAKIGQYDDEELEPETKKGEDLVCGDDTLEDEDPKEEEAPDWREEFLDEDYLDLTQ